MAVESDADRAVFFETNEFGVAAQWLPAGVGPGSVVNGIFEAGHASPGLGELAGESREITFRCRSADLSTAQQGDTLTVAGVLYRVRSARPDGTGLTVLVLGT